MDPLFADVEQLPLLLTVPEAARVLRIGRTTAYALAEFYLATGGAEGLPVCRVGHQLRVPRDRLLAYIARPPTADASMTPLMVVRRDADDGAA